jgi:RNA polymerase sigma-70 factor (ECF subfamily)
LQEDRLRTEGYLRGDAEAFKELDLWIRVALRRRYPGLVREHEDLAQRVHAKLVASLREGRYESSRGLRAYVSGIVHHVAIDRLREVYRERVLSETLLSQPQTGTWEQPYDTAMDEDRLFHQAVLAVPPACREMWRMLFVEKMAYEEIGRRLSIPTGTVKSRMWHCRRKALSALRRLRLLHRSDARRPRRRLDR